MCPNCRAFITIEDKVCPYCEVRVGGRAIDQRMPDDLLGGLIPHAKFLTMLVLLINSGLYAAMMLYSLKSGHRSALTDIDTETLALFGAKYWPGLRSGQMWRLVTAGFLHAGILHFIMNMWALFDLGANVEEGFGPSRFISIYFVSTVAGFYLSAWYSPVTSAGASAGIFGLIGAMIAYGMHRSRSAMGQMIKTHYSRWAIYGLLFGLIGIFPIDNAAHIGGLAGGFVVAWLAGLPLPGNWRERIWNTAAALSVAITVLAFVEMGFFFQRFAR